MTLQSARATGPEPAEPPEATAGTPTPAVRGAPAEAEPPDWADRADGSGVAGAAEVAEVAGRVRGVVQAADAGAVWGVGGPDGLHGGSAADGPDLDVGGLIPVLALWPVIGSLVAEDALRLHTPIAAYGAEAAADSPAGTTTHHLLSHSTGPAAHTALIGLAEHLTGSTLADLAATRIWHPLGMTGTRFADGTLRAPLADLVRFLSHLLSPTDRPPTRAWITESLRIRTGELTPARGLLWQPGPYGTWSCGEAPTVWVSPRLDRWATLLPTLPPGPLRPAFREAAFGPAPS
ncbi:MULTISPECIES: hypothetical protein [unclassified Streptomyces]|uniref:hypothetical protein n=1 Tax=unclassified Streptomyces TaxID=2593676 RepID=UPI002E1228FF|nr:MULTISPECIES: hypothetical protein [unclassified Streptomyces]WSR22697.1 serine hydrolase [Streptomyces sp. NBC_01205]